jgi:hypothetical protein
MLRVRTSWQLNLVFDSFITARRTMSKDKDEMPDLEALWASDNDLPVSEAEQEALWYASSDPAKMLDLLEGAFADGEISERKIRLFVCACCRRLWHKLSPETRQNHVDVAERYVDGRATREEFEVVDWAREEPKELAIAACCRWDFDPYGGLYYLHYEIQAAFQKDKLGTTESAAQAHLLRDIFRVPYPRPVTFDLAWKTTEVIALANTIYDKLAFDRMPILADALEEAGCHNAEILSHCREPADHVRGCWLIDLILGKA